MKNTKNISNIAIACALCATVATPAMSAAPVRALGGAGTYSSASGAAAAKGTTVGSATRAGVTRVLPSTTKATTTAGAGKTASGGAATTTRVSATPRLSIGKYLPNRVVASTGSATDFVDKDKWEHENSALSKMIKDIDTAVNKLEVDVESVQTGLTTLEGDMTALEGDMSALEDDMTLLEDTVAAKQDALVGDAYIIVDGENVSLDVDALQTALGKNGDTVDILYDDVAKKLTWTINGVVSDGVSFGEFATKQDVQDANDALVAALEETVSDTVDAKLEELTVPADKFADVPALAPDEVAMLTVDENNNRTWVVYKVQ